MKYFYSHLIEIESVVTELDRLNLSTEEKIHLGQLIDSGLHHTILEAILSNLTEEDKKIFLKHVHESSHDKIWQFLHEKIDHIEDKIKKVAEDLKKEMHEDVKKAHRIKDKE